MTAADMEAERQRMQEQWRRQGGTATSVAQVPREMFCCWEWLLNSC
jgi:hypothetical protein